jgi:NADH-quinone oxidoreductase subunit L
MIMTTSWLVMQPSFLDRLLHRTGFGDVHIHERVQVLRWISSGALGVDWAFRLDTLTAVMLVVVNSVSALVHLYSIGYMSHDPHRARFFAYLSLFTFAMLMLVTPTTCCRCSSAGKAWALASYLLIGFWYKKPRPMPRP